MFLFRLLTDLDGRIDRTRFWLGSVLICAALLALGQAAPALVGGQAPAVIAFAGAFALFPWSALAAKRASDRGGSPLFGILLVCAIVLPEQAKPLLPDAMMPSLETIALIAWVVALIDLGLLPAADEPATAKA